MRATRGTLAALLLVVGSTALVGENPADAEANPCSVATIVGTGGDDVLEGTDGADVIDGGGGDDRILGLGGDDVLCGGEGQDDLLGGPGADTLHGGIDAKVAEDTDYYVYEGDVLAGGADDDVLDPGADPRHAGSVDTISYLHAPAGVTADLGAGTVTGEGDDNVASPVATLVGSAYDDVLKGSGRSETLIGGAGRDRLVGLGGADLLAGGSWGRGAGDRVGNVLVGGTGRDELHGSDGDDVVRGGPGDDFVQSEHGRDRSWGGAGNDHFNDVVEPAAGQLIRGGTGRDELSALSFVDAAGQDQRHARGRIDLVDGTTRARLPDVTVTMRTAGIEDVITPPGDLWTVWGTPGRNDLMAGSEHSPVRLYGLGGDDQLNGSFEDDLLDGGAGRDSGCGWTGHDRIRSIERLCG